MDISQLLRRNLVRALGLTCPGQEQERQEDAGERRERCCHGGEQTSSVSLQTTTRSLKTKPAMLMCRGSRGTVTQLEALLQ